MPRSGSASAPCMRPTKMSRRRSSAAARRSRSRSCWMPAPAPAGCSNCWRRMSSAPSASMSARRCWPSRATGWRAQHCPACQVRLGDTYRLPFPDGSAMHGFDAVLFHQVLHYLDDPGAAVAEAARVMRAGRAAADRRFRAARAGIPARRFRPSPARLFRPRSAGLVRRRRPEAGRQRDHRAAGTGGRQAHRQALAAPHGQRSAGRGRMSLQRPASPTTRADLGVVRILAAQDGGGGRQRCGTRSAGWSRCSPPSSPSPMARAARRASAPTPPSSASSRRPR